MGFRVDFEDGGSVNFETQPTQADIDEAHAHVKASSSAMSSNVQQPQVAAQGQVPQANSVFNAGLPAGLLETATTGAAQAIGGGLAKGLGGVVGAVTPGQTAAGMAGKFGQAFSNATDSYLNPQTESGKAIMDKIGGAMTGFQDFYKDPANVQKVLGAIPFMPQSVAQSPEVGGAASGLAQALPDLSVLTPLLGHKAAEAVVAKAKEAPTGSAKLDALDALDQTPSAAPEVPASPLVDTRPSMQKTQEAYQQALREKQLAQQSAFNRPDSLPDLTDQQSPMQRMAKDLGAPELNQESFGARSGVGDMANRLLTKTDEVDTLSPAEKQMKDAQDAQAAVEARQTALEDAVKKQAALDNGASMRARQEAAGAVSDAHQAYMDAQADAKRASDTARMANASQPEMFEGQGHGYGPTPYDIGGEQHWVKDENGMPIRADLSMEAQNLQNPHQANLWGDELAPKHELETTKMPPLGSMARAALRKGQGGMINPRVFQEGFEKVKELANGVILRATGKGDTLNIVATKDGQHVGGVVFNKTDPYGSPMHSDATAPMVGSKLPGTATEMYKFSSELGNDIVPSGRQTEAGKAMWQGFADKGLAKQGYIPKSQRGGLNTDAAKGLINHVASYAGETVNKLSDFFKDVVNYRYNADTAAKSYLNSSHSETLAAADKFAKPMDPQATIAKVLSPGVQDLPSMNILSRSLQSGMDLMASKFRENPLMIEASRVLTNAAAKTQLQVRTLVKPLEKVYSSLPTKDMIEVQGVLKKEQMRGAPYTESQLRGAGFNERQIAAYTMQRDAYKTALDVQNKSRDALDMDPVTKLDQYYSSVWHGDWHMPILDKQGKLAWYIRTTTRAEGNKALAYLKDKMGDTLDLEDKQPEYRGSKGSTSGPTDVVGAYHDMQNFFTDDPKMSAAIKEALGGYMESKGYGLAGQSKHFLSKGNIRGFEGDKPWLSDKQNAYSGASAQINYLKNALRWSNHQEAIANVKQVLADPQVAAKMPNAVEYAHSVLAHEAGSVPTLTNSIENSLAQLTGRSKSNLYQGIGDLKTGMYLQSLGLNTAYMIATPMQYAITGPAWHAVLSAQGFKTGIAGGAKTIGLAFTDASAGILSHMAHELGMKDMQVPMSTIGKAALQYAEDAGIVSRNLFDEGGGIGEHSAFTAVKNGLGWTIGFPEKVARMNAFMGFVHHLDASGKYAGDQLGMFRHAEEYTGRAMTSFMSHDRPQVVSNLGGLGQLGYVYKSYVFNQAHTMNAMGRMATEGNFLPIASLIAGYGLMSGVTNMPAVGELDGLWNAAKDAMANYYPEQYVKHNLVNKDLKAELVKLLPESAGIRSILQKGAVSAGIGAIRGDSGPDIGSHLGSQILDTEHPTNNIPGAAPAQELKEWSSVGKTLYHRDSDSVMSALHANMPPLVKGLMENDVKNFSQGAGTNTQLMYKPDDLNSAKTMEHRRTLEDQSYRSSGLTSFAEAQDKRNIFRTNEDEMRNQSALKTLSEHVASGIKNMGNGGEEKAAQALTAIKTLNPNANISDEIKRAGMSVYTTPMEQRELNMRSIRMMQYYQRYAGQPK